MCALPHPRLNPQHLCRPPPVPSESKANGHAHTAFMGRLDPMKVDAFPQTSAGYALKVGLPVLVSDSVVLCPTSAPVKVSVSSSSSGAASCAHWDLACARSTTHMPGTY